MNVWLVKTHENIPLTDSVVLSRMGQIAEWFFKRGHHVTWWATTFQHFSKKDISNDDTDITINDRYMIKCFFTKWIYKKNISLARIIHNIIIAYRINKQIHQTKKPDLIVCAYPTIELAYVMVRYAKKNKIKIMIDARDMWPEMFLYPFSPRIRPLIKLCFTPYFYLSKYIFNYSDAIVGITESFVDWGLSKTNFVKRKNDQSFYLAYEKVKEELIDLSDADHFWNKSGVVKSNLNIIYFGTFSKQKIQIDYVVDLVHSLKDESNIRFIFSGIGDDLAFLKNKLKHCSNTIFTGWIGKVEKHALLSRASIGLAPYRNKEDYKSSIPTKIIEYLSAGLPIITGLEGETQAFLQEYPCGGFSEKYNVQQTIQFLKNIITHKNVYNDLSQQALKAFKLKFDSNIVYKNYVKNAEDLVFSK